MMNFLGIVLSVIFGLQAGAAEPPVVEAPLARSYSDPDLKWGPCPRFIPEGCAIAVLHGDPSKPNADIFFKVRGGLAIPEHWHTSAERMALVSGEMTVTFKGQPTMTLKSGMYAYAPAKEPHRAECAKGADCVLFIAFEAPVDAFATETSR
jgi:quercetin dioxygenase-like cupin family protein